MEAINSNGEMNVDGEVVQELYRKYSEGKYIINRRYQRKLVWSQDQKESLIDSIVQGLPIPLILLAEKYEKGNTSQQLEIIDGLQRLNAITAFINNEYSYKGKYFDLETLASTKAMLDDPNHRMKQKLPVMSREASVGIANYKVPVSTYSTKYSETVDEVFRRINSSGRKLSRQEVRQAGVTGRLATLIRQLSSGVRGDSSLSDIVPLRDVPLISMKSKDDEVEGIVIDDIFWVRQGVLLRDDLRGSLDEQLVLDIVLDLIELRESVSSNTKNQAYNQDSDLYATIDSKIRSIGEDKLKKDFSDAFDVIEELAKYVNESYEGAPGLMGYLGKSTNTSKGRYFHVLFIAIHRILRSGKVLGNVELLADILNGYWLDAQLPSGSTWPYEERTKKIAVLRRQITESFVESSDPIVEDRKNLIERFWRSTHSYLAETQFFELKVGLVNMDQPVKSKKKLKFSDDVVDKIAKTATAMANSSGFQGGYIYVGVTDDDGTVDRVSEIYEVDPMDVSALPHPFPFYIFGVDHELRELGMSVDVYVSTLVKKIRDSSRIGDSGFATALANSVEPLPVCTSEDDTRHVIAINVPQASSLVEFDGTFFDRVGSDCRELKGSLLVNAISG
ncbi:GmrSD restriction endonuclease domain-containing protein [Corynebacterium variabile]|uniref:GmrSD restriction endonuclease domain-containing protein n=1 Tax=Corynebacterium variabile TaxID=1727 RepID=UPI003FD369BE